MTSDEDVEVKFVGFYYQYYIIITSYEMVKVTLSDQIKNIFRFEEKLIKNQFRRLSQT